MTQGMNSHARTRRAEVACAETRVLVVDDDRNFRELARHLLELDGIRVMEAASISKGLACLRSHAGQVDAVIMDLLLPDGDGIQTISELKTAFPGTKVVAVSGVDASTVKICSHLRADAFLAKSRVESLPALVLRVLNR
jgi:two-component system KDP operon response regulator KdpE